jgi:hypothetical protein
MKIQSAKAGIGTGRAGLQAASGLFSSAGLFQKGVKSFHPNDLDPYLLFDAETSMIGTLENPTLDLDPATPSTLDVITATRAGVATYTDPDGNIATASADTVRVDYTQGAELTPTKFQHVGYTDFTSGWAAQNGVAAQVADDYQGNAVRRLTFDGVTTGGIYQNTINTISGVTYTGSFYIRRISGSTPLYMRHGFSASGNQSVISVTTEWQKFSVTILGASGGGNVYFGLIQFGAGNDVYEITQPQFEEGTTATDFVANTTGSPKFITGATYSPRVPMILVEPSATNLLPYSEDFSSGGWNITNGTLTPNYAISPEGVQNGSKINFSAGGEIVRTTNFTAGQSYTFSFYAKVESGTFDFTYGNIDYTLVSGTATTEWQRFEVTQTAPVATRYPKIDAIDTGDLLIWGAQLETGSVATSLIPTAGGDAAARTRASDDLVISGSAFSDFYNASEGTFYCEFQTKDANPAYYILNSQSEQARFFYSNNNTNTINSFDGTTATALTGLQDNTLCRVALSIKASEFKASKDGSSEAVAAHNGNLLTVPTELRIGKSPYSSLSLNLNGHIKRVIYWPYHSDSL